MSQNELLHLIQLGTTLISAQARVLGAEVERLRAIVEHGSAIPPADGDADAQRMAIVITFDTTNAQPGNPVLEAAEGLAREMYGHLAETVLAGKNPRLTITYDERDVLVIEAVEESAR